MTGYKRTFYISIVVIALGVTYSTTISGPLGTVMIAVGGLLFIVAMSKNKQQEDEKPSDH